MTRSETFDHIVIGGGSSGCMVASRLATEAGARVLLLEAGYSHHHPLLDMPPGIFKLIGGSKYMRYHTTTPQPQLDGRQHDIPQGHVLGGGSSVNAQVYMRGRPSDYDEWDDILRGNNDGIGWGWDDVLPHFRTVEGNNRLSNDLHGNDGPLQVSDPGHVDEFSQRFVQSVQQLGEPYTHDFNGSSQRGVGYYQFTNRRGKRSSAAYAFLEPLKDNPNLAVRLQCEVHRVVVEKGRAVAVTYADGAGDVRTVHADGEIVITAGALMTPKVLMLSGIGPSAHLAEHNIDCVIDAPGVGQNLIDHPEVPMTTIANGKYGYHKQSSGWRMLLNGLQFKLFGTGRITTAGFEAGAFVNPIDRDAEPTIQAFAVPIFYLDRDNKHMVADDYGFTITTVVTKPKSRGEVRLASANPSDMPVISSGLLSHPDDMATMIAGQQFFLKALKQPPLAERIDRIVFPTDGDESEATLEAHCKRMVKTNYHPASTAKMGADGDPMAVLDARMRVRGVEGLRVCDMSAVPNINAGNTNAPAIMLGHRCADLIMGSL